MRLICLLGLLFCYSCGRNNSQARIPRDRVTEHREDDVNLIGQFRNINSHTVRLHGRVIMRIEGDQFHIQVSLNGAPSLVRFQQYIHFGSSCPTKSADFDQNGTIDFDEAAAVSGPLLVPLDKNLAGQEAGSEWFPETNSDGRYYYSRAVSLSKFLIDLFQEDRFPSDGMVKLTKGEKLDLLNRVVMIYGAEEDPRLPVACAKLKENSF